MKQELYTRPLNMLRRDTSVIGEFSVSSENIVVSIMTNKSEPHFIVYKKSEYYTHIKPRSRVPVIFEAHQISQTIFFDKNDSRLSLSRFESMKEKVTNVINSYLNESTLNHLVKRDQVNHQKYAV